VRDRGRYCRYGASARNGGLAEGSWAKFPAMRRLYGQAEALRLATAIEDGVDELDRFCADNAIDAELRRAGHAWIASNQSQLGAWEGARSALAEAGHDPFRDVDADEARRLTSSPLACGGVFEADAATVQPGKLVRGLRRVALERGARIFEHTEMRGFDRAARPVAVQTVRGTIAAGKVVLAMNAWSAAMPEVKPHVFVTSSDIVATAPDAGLPADGIGSGIGISDSRRLILYWRSTPDGRIVFGKGGGWMSINNRIDGRFTGRSALAASVEARFRRLYPELRDVPLQHSWNGPIDYSSTGLPYFGPLSDDAPAVLVGVGYSGMGVVQTVLGGRILASLALGRDDEYSSLPLTRRWEPRIPPEPFRSIGAPLVKTAIAKKEPALDAEARPGGLVSLLATLDPTAAPTQS
jgi:glycine/D-amino acid oxidase-like deaminating enzyme